MHIYENNIAIALEDLPADRQDKIRTWLDGVGIDSDNVTTINVQHVENTVGIERCSANWPVASH